MPRINLNVSESPRTATLHVNDNTGDASLSIEQVRTVTTTDYNRLFNKPSIEGIELVGDKTLRQFGLTGISNSDIDDIIFGG